MVHHPSVEAVSEAVVLAAVEAVDSLQVVWFHPVMEASLPVDFRLDRVVVIMQ